ncbi:MAG: HAMP domain-containing sensor histidine kinase [Fermentimonas sp.]|nr:HAMP domain-containing sensor histidine kinase [Fermentimonas sp.]MDD4009027.1 HAMP domain-containing sensor histidine kinase [Fermentimonas sp.]
MANKNIVSQPLTILFVVLAIVAALLSLIVSNLMVKELAAEERSKMEVWALATESMMSEEIDAELVLTILQSNTTIPVIMYDRNLQRIESHNIKLPKENAESYLLDKIEKFKRRHEPIVLSEMNQILYYDDSYTLKRLQFYPYLQLFVIALFIGLAFLTLNRSKRAEQNRVWVGLSKETAHQLGTPISSLMAWSEYLKLKEPDNFLLTEIDKDTYRLQMIAERFSKIGSEPDLKSAKLQDAVKESLSYMENRISERVSLKVSFPEQPIYVMMNEPLFSWVIENLTKNGVDAMKGEGEIAFSITEENNRVFLDIKDSGKGIPKSKYKKIFSPGYTTKERGWGLGLSLVKRIIEVNHKGQIFVKQSETGKGTTLRISLKKAD